MIQNKYSITPLTGFAIISSISVTLTLLLHYYNHFWYPPDDGAYAHVADRILAGDILNWDVHDIHMGYINFINALSLKIFGAEMVSLRIPLVILGVVQSLILFRIFQPKGLITAFMASVIITAFSFIQFLNPTANWYGLFLTISVIYCLDWRPAQPSYRIVTIGFLLMLLFLFRQLTGIITTMGVLTFLLFRAHENIPLKDSILSKFLFVIMLSGLSGYLAYTASTSVFFIFGLGPIVLIVIGLYRITVNNHKTLKMIIQLLTGGICAAAPLVIYHLYHGSVSRWYEDVVLSALLLTKLSFIETMQYSDYIIYNLFAVFSKPSWAVFLNSFLWISLVLVAFFTAIFLSLRLLEKNSDPQKIPALPMISIFYALVSIHFQIPIYLFYSAGLSLCTLLWLLYDGSIAKKTFIILCLSLLSFTAIYYHSGQPASRSVRDILQGVRTESAEAFLGGNVNLWIEPKDAALYYHIKALIHEKVGDKDTIFAFPSNPEIYFIAQKQNPFRFFNMAFGILSEEQYEDVLSSLKNNPPRLVFYTPSDKYNTPYTQDIARYIGAHYDLIDKRDGIEIYQLRKAP
ncbi:MAG: glycosyltransferase family 39 protein [Emcibacter sp.]|nr:glycosyltransferase family 39 protein [Emcibacter sp.]